MIIALPSKSLFHLGVDTKKDLEEANELQDSIRGAGGFGSTGK